MKTLATVVLILQATLNAGAEARLQNNVLVVLAYVRYNPGKPSLQTLAHAEDLASQMFAKAGVRIIWHSALPAVKRGEMPILIEITLNPPDAFHRGALAYSQPFDGAHITIFWDRLRGTPDSVVRTGLLAHVLVHEITHILQGTNHHSREGIMKAHWTSGDVLQMARTPLSFDPADVKLIRLGLAARSSVSQGDLPGPGPHSLH
jgi:hypothetical protein